MSGEGNNEDLLTSIMYLHPRLGGRVLLYMTGKDVHDHLLMRPGQRPYT